MKNTPWLGPDLDRMEAGFNAAFVLGKKPVIAIDWNSTIQNQIGEICRRTNLRPADFDRWDPPLGSRCGMTDEAFTAWAWGDESIQWMADPYPGAPAAIARLASWATIWIVTSTCQPHLVPKWLRKHNVHFDRIILTGDKGSVEWDVLIDDNPATLESLAAGGRQVLRHEIEWNKNLTHIKGVKWL